METPAVQNRPLETIVPQVGTVSMQTFCEDMDGMLGISIGCSLCQAAPGTLEKLQPFFPKVAAVYSVQARGALSGQFELILDKTALFLLSGLIVMLPPDKIKEQCKHGTLEQALKLSDTIKEIGNLIVGAWDRIFREQLPGHKHLLQTNTQITNLWDKPEEILRISRDTTCLLTVWEMTIGDYPPFHGAAVFPAALFEPPREEPTSSDAAPQESAAPADPQAASSAQPEPNEMEHPAGAPEPAPADSTPAPKNETDLSQSHPVWTAIQQLTQSEPTLTPAKPLETSILNCPARYWMNTKPLWLSPNDSVETALQRMQQHNTRYALIEEKDQMVGILSQGDLNAALSPYLRSPFEEYRRPLDEASLQIRIRWFMSRPVRTATPDTPLWKVMDTMCRHQIRALPVQDTHGSTVGLITVLEIFQKLLQSMTDPATSLQTEEKECLSTEPNDHEQS